MELQRTPESRYSIKKKKGYVSSKTENLFQQIKREKEKKERQRKNRIGELSEEKASLALDNLEEKLRLEELIYFQHDATQKNSAADHNAIDHILIFMYPEHERTKFQIKNSEMGAKKHKKLYPNIPIVVSRVSKQEIEKSVFLNMEETEKEILDKLFGGYFIRNYSQQEYNKFLKKNYGE